MLLARNEPEVATPYRDQVDLVRQVGQAVSARAAGVFLVARMTARDLRSMDRPVDVHRSGWQSALPSEIGEAFEDYLMQFGPDESRVRALLTPLAFAEGQGLAPRRAVDRHLDRAREPPVRRGRHRLAAGQGGRLRR